MRRLSAVAFVLPLGLWVLFAGGHFHLNRSDSLPIGLYREDRSLPLAYGTYVSCCFPEGLAQLGRARGYLPAGDCPGGVLPVLKRIAALPGDRVRLSEAGLEVQGVPLPRTARLAVDHSGRPIPGLPEGWYRVPPGAAWLVGNHRPNSWDSRYYGPVPLASLRPARPVVAF